MTGIKKKGPDICQKHQLIQGRTDSSTKGLLSAFRMLMCAEECFPDSFDHWVSVSGLTVLCSTNTIQGCLVFGEMGDSIPCSVPLCSSSTIWNTWETFCLRASFSISFQWTDEQTHERAVVSSQFGSTSDDVSAKTTRTSFKTLNPAYAQANPGSESSVLMPPRARVHLRMNRLVLFPDQIAP